MSSREQHRPQALVTGASSGIGSALARRLARAGHDVVLVARDRERLTVTAAECAVDGARCEILVADLTEPGDLERVAARIATGTPPIDVLVNNAGFAVHGDYERTPLDRELAMVDLSVRALLVLTKAALPGLVARGRGCLLNVSSVYAYAAAPGQAVYGASKAFIASFSDALGEELRDTGVTVTVACPGSTRTELRTRAGVALRDGSSSMSADDVADCAVRAALSGRPSVVTGGRNRLYAFASRLLSRRAAAGATRRINRARGVGEASSS